jgi:hypothetical protein
VTVRYSGQTTTTINGVEVPVAQVTVYVYDSSTGLLAALTADGGGALANPFTSDTQGNFAFNVATAGLYDVVYYIGGKQVLRQNGVPVGTGNAPLTAFVQNIINLTPFTVNVTTGTPFGYPTRGGIIGITDTTIGKRVYLSEAGRQGWWELTSGSFASLITTDVYQGLYLPHFSLATSAAAWVREVKNAEYYTSWWAPEALGNNAHLALITINALIPSTGCHVIFPPNVTYTTSDIVRITKDGVILRGAGYSSWLKANTAATAFHLLWIQGSHCKVLNLKLTGFETNLFSNNPACIIVQNAYGQGGPAGTLAQRLTDDTEIAFCNISNTSLGIVFAASADTDPARNNGQIIVPSTNGKIHHNTITTSMHGCEIFGSDYLDAHDNRIASTPNTPANQFSGCFRVLGSQEVEIHDNNLTGLGYARTDHAIFFLSAADFVTGARRANKNLRIRNNDCTNSITFMWVEECTGTLLVQDNNWKESPSGTAQTRAFYFNIAGITDGLLPIVEKTYITDNVFEGVACYIEWASAGGTGKHLYSSGNRIIGNSWTIATTGRILNALFPSANLYEFDGDKFLMSDGGGLEFAFKNAAGFKLRFVGCHLPWNTTGNAPVDSDGSGTIIKSVGNTGEVALVGFNDRYAAGTFATVV